MELTSQKMRRLAPELDPLRLGTGWTPEDLAKPQIMIESTFGDSHPGSGHLDKLVAEACRGAADAGGHGARYFCTDICDGESQGTDGINYSLASREIIADMIEIHAGATPFDGPGPGQRAQRAGNGRHHERRPRNAHAGAAGRIQRPL